MTFHHCTIAQMRAYIRERFRNATREEAIRIGRWLDANLTDAELKTLFSLSTAQTTALRTKLQQSTTLYNSIQAAAGA